MIRMTYDQFRRLKGEKANKIYSTRAICPVRKDNPKTKVLLQAVQKVPRIRRPCQSLFYRGNELGLFVRILGKGHRADRDNIFKGVQDALTNTAYPKDAPKYISEIYAKATKEYPYTCLEVTLYEI